MNKKYAYIGLTGLPGSGKTTIAKLLQSFGTAVIDVDAAGRWVLENDETVKAELKQTFGHSIFAGDEIDRKKLGKYVFANSEELEKLNRIVHPAMLDRVNEQLDSVKSDTAYVIIDAAILYELNLDEQMDAVVVVYAQEHICIERTVERLNISAKQALQRLHAQAPLDQKLELADYIIENNGSFESLRAKVFALHRELQKTYAA
ncbi:dephospho-CoA kinase [candidate division KSB1 bacterium]|jgi:dephospho-CoA kinase|nr:dephospho-CoA kinase [candidate division KSB1 bacterium]